MQRFYCMRLELYACVRWPTGKQVNVQLRSKRNNILPRRRISRGHFDLLFHRIAYSYFSAHSIIASAFNCTELNKNPVQHFRFKPRVACTVRSTRNSLFRLPLSPIVFFFLRTRNGGMVHFHHLVSLFVLTTHLIL